MGAEEHEGGLEMMGENWKPSFMEVPRSRSWTEHLIVYFASFGALLYPFVSPQDWKGWSLVTPGAAGLATGYWAAKINFNRRRLERASRRLLLERRELARLERELREEARRLETIQHAQHGNTPDKQFIQ